MTEKGKKFTFLTLYIKLYSHHTSLLHMSDLHSLEILAQVLSLAL